MYELKCFRQRLASNGGYRSPITRQFIPDVRECSLTDKCLKIEQKGGEILDRRMFI